MITPFRQIRNGFRRVKWWFMRANGTLPPCDWWDYKYSLADFIKQGLSGLLHEGVTDWDSKHHKKEKKDLEFVLDWAIEFPYYESGIIASNEDDCKNLKNQFGDEVLVMTKDDFEEFQKRTEKAFKLLAKNIHTLWD